MIIKLLSVAGDKVSILLQLSSLSMWMSLSIWMPADTCNRVVPSHIICWKM
jgi:hypothetical protein